MKKKLLISAVSLILAVSSLAACGGKKGGSSSAGGDSASSLYDPDDPNSSVTPGSIVTAKTVEDALSYNYDNYSVVYDQLYMDGEIEELAYEFYVDGVTVMLDYTYAEMYGEIRYLFYSSTAEDDYAYWTKADGYDYDGWIANGWRDADLAMYHAYFDLHHFLSALTVDDIEIILGMAFVKEESMSKLQNCGLEFFGDPFVGDEEITSVGFLFDKDTGAITKITGSVSDTSDDGFIIELSEFGTTKAPAGVTVPKTPYRNSDTDRNIYTYQEMKGDEYVADVWPTSVTLATYGDVVTEAGYDAVIDIDSSVDIGYTLLPENVNRTEYEWIVSDPTILDLNHKTNTTTHHKYATGERAGEAYVSIKFLKQDGTYLESNKLKIKVKSLQEQDKSNAVYDLTVTGSRYETIGEGEDAVSDVNKTIFSAYNAVNTTAQYSIKGHNAVAMEAKNTDSFGESGMVTVVSPSSQEYMHDGNFYSDMTFDFGDQEVVSMSFYYALYKANQRGAALMNLETAYVATSSDGVTWGEPISIKEEMLANFENINLNYGSNLKLMEVSFAKTSHVRIYFKAMMVGNHFQICMNDFVFSNDETCHNHGVTTEVAVTGVTISSSITSVKLDKTIQFSAEVAPENATNKNVAWFVSDETKASISASGLFTPKAAGTVKVYAMSTNFVKSNEIEVTIIGQEELDAKYVGQKYLANTYVDGISAYKDVVLTIDSAIKATLKIGDSITLEFTYYSKDDSRTPIHTYYGANNEKLSVSFYKNMYGNDVAEVFLDNYAGASLGNHHTNSGEELALYIASSSITIKHDSSAVTSVDLKVGDRYQITTAVNPTNATDKEIASYVSSNTSVATVTEGQYYGYVVTAVGAGTAVITFKNSEGKEGKLTVNVSAPVGVSSLSLSATSTSIEVGKKTTISVTINPNNADTYDLEWTNSSSTNASMQISNDKKSVTLTAKAAGTATITVKDKTSNKTANIVITITAPSSNPLESLVGVWSGENLVGEFTFTVSSDGSAVLADGEEQMILSFDNSLSTAGSVVFVGNYYGDEVLVTISDISGKNATLLVTWCGEEYFYGNSLMFEGSVDITKA